MSRIQHKMNASHPKALTLGELAQQTGCELRGSPDILIVDVGQVMDAKPGEITFLAEAKLRPYLLESKASAVILTSVDAKECVMPALIGPDPKTIFARVAQLLYPYQTREPSQHATALIGQDCDIHPLAFIGPYCVIGNHVKIHANVILEAGCTVGDHCEIGAGSVLYPKVTLYHGCQIGKQVVLHAGVIIGSDGFGYAKNKENWIKIPQVGKVKIGDRVEIGANTTIDRGAVRDTEIEDDVILDNLIQIGHNVKIGKGTAVAACSGIAGSTVIGKHCLIGGGSRINGHITICDYVQIVGTTNVAQSIEKPGAYGSSTTANEIKIWKRNLVRFHQLDEMANRIKELEKEVKAQQEDKG